jgi:hypothetical protein
MVERKAKSRPLCDDLRRIEDDLLKQLTSLYYSGKSFEAFWDMVERIAQFADLRRKVCGEDVG